MKKLAVLSLLGALSFNASADWQAGFGYLNMSEDDISLSGIVGEVGHNFEIDETFHLIPSLRIGTGLSDDSISVNGWYNLKVELDSFLSLDLKTKYDFTPEFYGYVTPSYANAKVTASFEDVSESENDWEFGIGAGFGYEFAPSKAIEVSYQTFDGTDVISASFIAKF